METRRRSARIAANAATPDPITPKPIVVQKSKKAPKSATSRAASSPEDLKHEGLQEQGASNSTPKSKKSAAPRRTTKRSSPKEMDTGSTGENTSATTGIGLQRNNNIESNGACSPKQPRIQAVDSESSRNGEGVTVGAEKNEIQVSSANCEEPMNEDTTENNDETKLEPSGSTNGVVDNYVTPKTTSTRSRRQLVAMNYAAPKKESNESSACDSSPSNDSDGSDFEEETIRTKQVRRKGAKAVEVSDADGSSDEEIEFTNSDEETKRKKKRKNPPKSKSSSRRGSGSGGSGSSRPASRISQNGNRRVCTKAHADAVMPAPRTVNKGPPKPWLNKPLEATTVGGLTVPAPVRKLNSTEKKILEFRNFAIGIAPNYHLEMESEEAMRVWLEAKRTIFAKYFKGQLKTVAPGTEQPIPELEQVKPAKSDDEGSSSEDEWEEMELIEGLEQVAKDEQVQVTIGRDDDKKDMWLSDYLRLEVNKKIREMWDNAHRAHLLCYIGHLQYLLKAVKHESLIPSLMLTQMPSGYAAMCDEPISVDVALKIVKWFNSAFKVSPFPIIAANDPNVHYPMTSRLEQMIADKVFETDADRACLLFSIFVALGCTSRICVNTVSMPRKWDESLISSWKKDSTNKKDKPGTSKESKQSDEANVTKKSKTKNTVDSQIKKELVKAARERNYWVEYWNKREKRWVCVDPLTATVDDLGAIEEKCTQPVCYVFGIDTDRGVRDITVRYASDFLRPEFRRRRTDPQWLANTLRKRSLRANEERADFEDTVMKQDMVKKPLPTTLAEFKNHPFYVLEKDLLKFQALYPPPDLQTPLGTVRGKNVYPRSTVYTLQSAKNWIKVARSVKEDEKPYKVVKGRPDYHIPAEQRVQRYLDLFGFWQTEQYRCPEVVDGRIPRNEYGNVYMYLPTMCPIGAVHLKLPGLMQIARRLNKECVPAVIGWDFQGAGNYPIIDGACVLKEDAEEFVAEWIRAESGREEREAKKREDRINGNWRRLIRGILRLNYVRAKFGSGDDVDEKSKAKKGKKMTNGDEGEAGPSGLSSNGTTSRIIDNTVVAKRQEFTLNEVMELK